MSTLLGTVGRRKLDLSPFIKRIFFDGTPSAVDFYCGIGGSSSGLVEAGFRVLLAANHSKNAIENHAANHPDTEHYLGDVQALDMRRLPWAWLLWASPICTELSPAGGRRKPRGQGELFELEGAVRSEDYERTRVTFWEVLRAAEVRRFPVVLLENVVEAADWDLFDVFLAGMKTLGYLAQFVSVSAAHIWDDDTERPNDPAAQWRDRMYICFTLDGLPLPDVEPTPLAHCGACGGDVRSMQWWKKKHGGRKIGKYGKQYVYVCPEGHGQVEPYVAPASTAIDWTDLGIRIGDRESLGMRPLGEKTRRRIELGAETVGLPALVGAVGNTWDAASGSKNGYVRAWPLGGSPTPSQVGTVQNGIALPEPFVTMLRANNRATSHSEPLAAFTTGRNHGLTIPGAFVSKHHGGYATGDPSMNSSVAAPLPTMTARGSRSLVIPYRKGAKPHPVDTTALSTVSTREAHAVLTAMTDAFDVDDCYFRMLKPREAANAQRFAPDYQLIGTKGQQQLGAGNAVAVNVAHWLGKRVLTALTSIEGGAA